MDLYWMHDIETTDLFYLYEPTNEWQGQYTIVSRHDIGRLKENI
jgi:hypothetical protein